jgi:predicted metal-dependent phosphoesterase TrpH
MQLAHLARRSGLAGLALTEHDALPDPNVLRQAGAGTGVELLVGIELSTAFECRGLHLLGYGFDPFEHRLAEACRQLRAARRERWSRMVAWLRGRGLKLDDRRLARLEASPAPGRLHLARELVHAGHAPSNRAAFTRYLGKMQTACQFECLPFAKAVDLIHGAGGVAVLAHPPSSLTAPQWRMLVEGGLDGIETGFPSVTKRHRRFLTERVAEYQLIATAGSDYHGDEVSSTLGRFWVDRASLERLVTVSVAGVR